jgi:hypothetical protein
MRDKVVFILLGFLLNEIYSFINNFGLSERYPLIRGVFLIWLSSMVIWISWLVDRFQHVETRLTEIGLNQRRHEVELTNIRIAIPQRELRVNNQ